MTVRFPLLIWTILVSMSFEICLIALIDAPLYPCTYGPRVHAFVRVCECAKIKWKIPFRCGGSPAQLSNDSSPAGCDRCYALLASELSGCLPMPPLVHACHRYAPSFAGTRTQAQEHTHTPTTVN